MRATVVFNSVSCVSMGFELSEFINFARANSDRLRDPEDADCKVSYSSSLSRKIRMRLRGLLTAMYHIPVEFHRDRPAQRFDADGNTP